MLKSYQNYFSINTEIKVQIIDLLKFNKRLHF